MCIDVDKSFVYRDYWICFNYFRNFTKHVFMVVSQCKVIYLPRDNNN